jgi:hypothetical protein
MRSVEPQASIFDFPAVQIDPKHMVGTLAVQAYAYLSSKELTLHFTT